ncbi:hypothetical protein [Paludisphaera borealis]|uniref:Peptidase C-terminal archaeal/bacterial domain-containing protein n=1 Tax=Paludisphaera borealis TaxID=1387353 RepID=A0A1U7CV06_9BACT|nr:hypothetical protein [Paludisphaera borealis]APW62780.1 hypothetical protein BSF38_04333 [Paludisphaera borealis]
MAVSLQLDYSLDSSGFFTSDRRALLESTLNAIASRLGDTLAAVSSYTYTISTSGGSRQVTTSVPANTIKLYPFGDALSGSTVGQGSGVWFESANNAMRGQGANDYAPNIGYIKFDNDGSTNWFFGATTAGLTGSQTDFVSVARHEFLHVLGMMPNQPTFSRYLQNSTFVGPNAKAAYHNSPVPMNGAHIANSVTSVMNAATLNGTREDLRSLEWGILKDIGWDVRSPAGFFKNWSLFTGGDGDGKTVVKVIPSQGVYMMQVDVLAGDRLRLLTRDGTSASERGVDSYLKIFNAAGQQIASEDDNIGGGKEDFTYTFANGGTYWVGVGTYDQREYSFTTPSTATPSSTAFYLEATLTGRADEEPNNIKSASTPIAFSAGRYVKQTTLAGGDADYYRIDAQAGHTYSIKAELPAGGGLSGSTMVSIYDASGRKIAGSDGSSRYGQTSFTAPASGPYFVLASSWVGADQVKPDELTISLGGSTVIGSEYSSSFDRVGGSDYTLSITDTAPPIQLGPHPVYLDFGPAGLWAWSAEYGYQQLSTSDPEGMVVGTDGSLYIDFGSAGVWRWTQSAGYQLISAANPEGMAAGVGTSLFLDFGPYGLWLWNGAGLQQLIAADPEGIAAAPDGSLYVDFGSFGLWRWTAGGGFQQLIAANPERIAIAQNGSNYDGSVFVDFGSFGLWRWTQRTGFQQLIAAAPKGMTAAPDGSLAVDFGSFGLWRWSAQDGFRQLNTAPPGKLAAAADGWLYIDFGPAGLWRWSLIGGYQKLHPNAVQNLAAR